MITKMNIATEMWDQGRLDVGSRTNLLTGSVWGTLDIDQMLHKVIKWHPLSTQVNDVCTYVMSFVWSVGTTWYLGGQDVKSKHAGVCAMIWLICHWMALIMRVEIEWIKWPGLVCHESAYRTWYWPLFVFFFFWTHDVTKWWSGSFRKNRFQRSCLGSSCSAVCRSLWSVVIGDKVSHKRQ